MIRLSQSLRKLPEKKFLKFIILILFIIISFLIVLSIYNLKLINLSLLQTQILSNFFQKSQIIFQVDENKLKLNFSIIDKDKLTASNLSKKLKVEDSWLQGIVIELDQESAKSLKTLLPEKIDLEFKNQDVYFGNSSKLVLNSALPAKDFNLATDGASLNFKVLPDRSYDLIISEPFTLVNYATSSGKLQLSSQLQGLFPILSKIAKIELHLKNQSLNGKIILK